MAASLAATAATSPHLPLAASEQHAVQAGLAVLRVKLGAVEERGRREGLAWHRGFGASSL